MAKITDKDISKLAQLSQIELSDKERVKYAAEIESILSFVEQLQKIDTEGVEETSQVTGLVNASRSDEIRDYGVTQQQLLQNAPDQDKGYIKVKRVL
jgi:aspartyl-tRNA(Asn)/glutamyl-tRNA(Gln) amidotransferase subunit C